MFHAKLSRLVSYNDKIQIGMQPRPTIEKIEQTNWKERIYTTRKKSLIINY
mgnify:CR=1 FL=1